MSEGGWAWIVTGFWYSRQFARATRSSIVSSALKESWLDPNSSSFLEYVPQETRYSAIWCGSVG
jgi:hypothetical protein